MADGDLVALDPADGSEEWRASTGGEIYSVAANNQFIAVGLNNGEVISLRPFWKGGVPIQRTLFGS
jgi:outer membrane protein assembly factor BamB